MVLSKPDGGVRPIAVGCILQRLVAKCISCAIHEAMSDLLAPLQLGYGGAEAAVHATRIYLTIMSSDHLLLKVEFTNAFNSIRRDKMLQACFQHAPKIYLLVHWLVHRHRALGGPTYQSSMPMSSHVTPHHLPFSSIRPPYNLTFCKYLQKLTQHSCPFKCPQ